MLPALLPRRQGQRHFGTGSQRPEQPLKPGRDGNVALLSNQGEGLFRANATSAEKMPCHHDRRPASPSVAMHEERGVRGEELRDCVHGPEE